MNKSKHTGIRLTEAEYDHLTTINPNVSKAIRELINADRLKQRDRGSISPGQGTGRRRDRRQRTGTVSESVSNGTSDINAERVDLEPGSTDQHG